MGQQHIPSRNSTAHMETILAQKRSFIRRLASGLWLTVSLLYSLLFLLILVAVPSVIYLMSHPPEPQVPNSGVLVIKPVGTLAEQKTGFGSMLENALTDKKQPSVLPRLITAIDRARNDDRIKALLLKLDQFGGAEPGQIQDLLAAIDRFRKSGKPVIAWSDAYDQSRYELASHADTIDLDPMGYVWLTGYSVYRDYYKDALDKIGVKVNVFRVGKYKSYVEPYTRNDMSDAARTENLAWMNSLWQVYAHTVAADRKLSPKDINNYIEDFASNLTAQDGNAAALAEQAGLVDHTRSFRQLRQHLIKIYGRDQQTHSFPHIDQKAYLADTNGPNNGDAPDSTRKLAEVVVDGAIINGESTSGTAGGLTISGLIDQARRDQQVAGLVLRVNSPGGSVTAAEQIRRSVAAFRQTGRPVVVSMGGLAASGGYWISANANQIWAEPSTITGSIGIFAMIPTFSGTLDKLGIHVDGVATSPLAGMLRLDRPLSDQAKTILQAGVDHGYDEFVSHVAHNRNMSRKAVNRIAQGRVWSGVDAKRIGLVDHLGDLVEAENAAAKLAGLNPGDYRLETISPSSNWHLALSHLVNTRIQVTWLPSWLSTPIRSGLLDFLKNLNDPRGLYARCFCHLTNSGPFSSP